MLSVESPKSLGETIPPDAPDLLRAQKLLNLSPELQQFAKEGLNIGHLQDSDLEEDKLKSEKRRFHTAIHENAHALVARRQGWKVLVISIIQEGNILGYVKTVPAYPKRIDQLLLEKIAICFAGMAGEELIGDTDHHGCGSDFYQAKRWAEILETISPEHQGEFYQLLEDGKNIARRIVEEAGLENIKDYSWDLMQRQKIVRF